MKIRAIGSNILAVMLEKGERKTAGGIVIPSGDDGRESGIRPRWCQVYAVGPDSELKDDISKDDWLCVAHGRWTQGIELDGMTVWKIDPDGILLHSYEHPDGI
jgi:co-chaperonin GroES (HSP10)